MESTLVSLLDSVHPFPFANLEWAAGIRKAHGIRGAREARETLSADVPNQHELEVSRGAAPAIWPPSGKKTAAGPTARSGSPRLTFASARSASLSAHPRSRYSPKARPRRWRRGGTRELALTVRGRACCASGQERTACVGPGRRGTERGTARGPAVPGLGREGSGADDDAGGRRCVGSSGRALQRDLTPACSERRCVTPTSPGA
jgi:hypothetical protein